MFNKSDITRNDFMLKRGLSKCGYDWWWHSFTAYHNETGEEKSFFIEFFTCNSALGKEQAILGQQPKNKMEHQKPSYVMLKAGAWGEDAKQLHRFWGWSQVKISNSSPFFLEADDCYVNETHTKGSVNVTEDEVQKHPEYMCQTGSMSWNLKIRKEIAFHVGYGASKLLRNLQAFEMFWHAEGMKTFYDGEVIWNGEHYTVTPATSYGYADKNWGKNFTSPWIWLSSNHLYSGKTGEKLENSVFNIGGGKPKIGPFSMENKLLSAFWYEGKEYEFNFSKFWTFTKTNFKCYETEEQIVWHVEQKNITNRMIADITCDKKDMLLINYEAPDGSKLHNRLWNGGNGVGVIRLYRGSTLIDEITAKNIGCEFGEYSKKQVC